MTDDDRIVENIIDSHNDNLWWRFYDLRGIKLKLKNPLSKFTYPHFNGDRNYITVHDYDPYLGLSSHTRSQSMFEAHEINDWIMFYNEDTPPNRNNILSLTLVDHDHFIEQIKENV